MKIVLSFEVPESPEGADFVDVERLVSCLEICAINALIDEKNFVKGCAMVYGKIFRKMEILVDGTAVLCCEDATKRTNYGNVFTDGVEKVWDNLRQEIVLIYSRKYTEAKKNLICNTCSRAKGNWTNFKSTQSSGVSRAWWISYFLL